MNSGYHFLENNFNKTQTEDHSSQTFLEILFQAAKRKLYSLSKELMVFKITQLILSSEISK